VTTRKNSDFWRYTFYGFVRDDGHAWLTPVAGDFSASAVVTGDYSDAMLDSLLRERTGPDPA
jgi:regulation of enolase protein 1 (concanavalin A-like superfamily)